MYTFVWVLLVRYDSNDDWLINNVFSSEEKAEKEQDWLYENTLSKNIQTNIRKYLVE